MIKAILFLWLVNFVPPFLSVVFVQRWSTPLDLNKTFFDGEYLFGSHKTFRGFIGAIVVGTVVSPLFGWDYTNGFVLSILSMVGDLATSFIKRRIKKPSGTNIAGLDQFLEGFLPSYYLHKTGEVGLGASFIMFFVFCAGAYIGAHFFKKVLLTKPYEFYPRDLNPRLRLREWKSCQIYHDPLRFLLNFEDAVHYHLLLKGFLKLSNTYSFGVRNALDLCVREEEFYFADLPVSFDGYTILFLSDIHINGHPKIKDRLTDILENIESCHLCILGGDYRMEEVGLYHSPFKDMAQIIPYLKKKSFGAVVGVLGNHDCIEMVDWFERRGVRMLINENICLEHDSDRVYIVGVDDPHYFKCHDLEKAFKGIPLGAFVIFVAHSPEVYREAERRGARLFLCGHTHAGQIQFPRVGPIFTHSRSGRRFYYGKWRYRTMEGYTSSGVGASGIFVRFGTRGEVVKVTLRKKTGEEEHEK